jgi:hypothetical protein
MPSFNRPVSLASAVAIASFILAVGSRSDVLAAPVVNAVVAKPAVSVFFAKSTRMATVRITFAGMPPAGVTISASMAMRGEMHVVNRITLKKTSDPHTLEAKLRLSMAGAWTIEVHYGKSREVDVSLKVAA